MTESSVPRDFAAELETLRGRLEAANAYLRLSELSARLAELETQLAEPDLWSDPDRARKVSTAYGRVKADVDLLVGLEDQLSEAEELLALGLEEGDGGMREVAGDLAQAVATLEKALDDIELRSLFSGEHDEADAIAEIHAGAGGTDAQDWAEMMLRMYLRWAERKGFEVEIDEVSEGQEAGILSATFIVRGPYAYGLLATERGVHRLVRMSPFDSQHRRQTSFASFEVVPFLEDAGLEVEIDEKDLRVDTYRSSGAGGQHVNKTDSAIRITHLPTGIVVSCQNERSQHQNRAKAMQILAAKLADVQRAERRAELDALTGPESDNAWGSQIRSYVMAPYQLVKDHRSSHETGNVDAVLDGDLDDLMVATLRWKREHSGR
ncbi:MAG: peptide chain release factor 2 [Acidimicrobiales bacterium]